MANNHKVIMSTDEMAAYIYTILSEHELTVGESLSSLKKAIKLVNKSVYYDHLKESEYEENAQYVSGRYLHMFLEIGTEYKDWFPRMCEYGFEVGIDFNPLKKERVQIEGNREVKRIITDHELTIDMAKQLCMLSRNEKGRQAREYFIQV